jgi:shikimate dehydrogenase
MSSTYVVIGNPIAHSRSPQIHAAFAKQTGQDLVYERLLAPVDGFAATVDAFRAAGGSGANVTLPFKLEAFEYVNRRSERAEAAGAVNTMVFDGPDAFGDNTDGAGFVGDLERNQGLGIAGARILLLGAGGAARGVILPLLERRPARLVVANRTPDKARDLAQHFTRWGRVVGCAFDELAGERFDLVVDGTSAAVGGAAPALPLGIFAPGALAYEMMYGKGETAFARFALAQGAARVADGLGMLVEQAAEAFLLWRGVRPDTVPVLAMLRASS